jgi:hypothetical protein
LLGEKATKVAVGETRAMVSLETTMLVLPESTFH